MLSQSTAFSKIQPVGILTNLASLLKNLTNEQYTRPLQVLSYQSVGAHCRHIIEFYLCLRKGIQENIICYEDRKRDMEIETNRVLALELIQTLNQWQLETDKPMLLQVGASSNSQRFEVNTSVFRELHYVAEHSIHHFAILKIGIESLGLPVSADFGVANSTLAYRTQCVS